MVESGVDGCIPRSGLTASQPGLSRERRRHDLGLIFRGEVRYSNPYRGSSTEVKDHPKSRSNKLAKCAKRKSKWAIEFFSYTGLASAYAAAPTECI